MSLSYSKKFQMAMRVIFSDVLKLSEAISFALSYSERFLKNLRSSLTFWGCLEVFRRYLRHFYGFQAGLKGSRRL